MSLRLGKAELKYMANGKNYVGSGDGIEEVKSILSSLYHLRNDQLPIAIGDTSSRCLWMHGEVGHRAKLVKHGLPAEACNQGISTR